MRSGPLTTTAEPRYMTVDEINALPIGSVVMTVTDPAEFGLYEQRVWQKFGGTPDWQFGVPRHEWQSTDGGFARHEPRTRERGPVFAENRKLVVLYLPDAATTSAILGARQAFLDTRARVDRVVD